jgi:hypothetical protein
MSGPAPSRVPWVLALLVIAVIVIAFLGVGLIGRGDAPVAEPDPASGTSAATSRVATSPTTGLVTPDDPPPTDHAPAIEVRIAATRPGETVQQASVIDELEDRDVLRLRVTDLHPGAHGFVSQCVREPAGFAGCTNAFPIQVNDEGIAYFQYQVSGDRQRCGTAASCVVVATDANDGEAFAYTVFGATAPPPAAVQLHPAGPYRAGTRVEVRAAPMAPGAAVDIAFCANSCGPSTHATADHAGIARASIVLDSTCVGGDRCVISVTGVATRDAVKLVQFVTGPTATYEVWRLAIGLTGAALLLLGVRVLARRTDWRAPSEAETPALDQVSL